MGDRDNDERHYKKKHTKKNKYPNQPVMTPMYPTPVMYPTPMMAQPTPMYPMSPQPVPMMQAVPAVQPQVMAVPIGPPVTVARPIGPPMVMPISQPAAVPQQKPKEDKVPIVVIKKYYKEDDSCCNIF